MDAELQTYTSTICSIYGIFTCIYHLPQTWPSLQVNIPAPWKPHMGNTKFHLISYLDSKPSSTCVCLGILQHPNGSKWSIITFLTWSAPYFQCIHPLPLGQSKEWFQPEYHQKSHKIWGTKNRFYEVVPNMVSNWRKAIMLLGWGGHGSQIYIGWRPCWELLGQRPSVFRNLGIVPLSPLALTGPNFHKINRSTSEFVYLKSLQASI